MGSTKRPFMKNVACPVVGDRVVLRGILVELSGVPSQVARKSCSNIEKCLGSHSNLEHISDCLLHGLRP